MNRMASLWTRAGGRGSSAGTALILAALALMGLTAAARAESGGTEVSDARFRLIIKSRPAAGYFIFTNATDDKKRLVGAASPGCGMLMMHQSQEVKGVEEMRPVKGIDVPPHGTVKFAPGGYHLMCMSPTAQMKTGTVVPVTLKFADGSTVTAGFKVGGATTQ